MALNFPGGAVANDTYSDPLSRKWLFNGERWVLLVPGVVAGAGTQTATSGTVVFSNSNGLTFGMSNSSVVTGSHNALTSQTAQTVGLYGSSNTSGTSSGTADARSLSFLARGGVSVDMTDGRVNISGITSTPQTNQTLGLYHSSNTTGQSSSSTVDARSITFRGAGVASIGMSAGEVIVSVPAVGGAGDGVNILAAGSQTANTTGTVRFADSNNITFGMNNSSVVTASASYPAQTSLSFVAGGIVSTTLAGSTLTISATSVAQTVQTVGLYGSGNTSGTSSGTADARSLTFQAQGSLTVDATNGRINLSAPNALTTAMASNRGTDFVQANAVFNGTNALGTIASNAVSVSVPAQTNQTAGLYAVGNTTQSTSGTRDARSLSFQGAGNVSVGVSGESVVISGAGGAGAAGSMSHFEPLPFLQSGSTTVSLGQGSWYFQPALLPLAIDSGRINVLHTAGSVTNNIPASTATSFASGTTGGHSESFVYNRAVAIYSQGTGTNNTRLESYWAGTFPISISQSVGVSLTNASQLTIQRQAVINYPSQIDISGGSTIATVQATHNQSFANSSTATSAVTSALSSIYNILTGPLLIPVNMNTSLSAGNWWLAHATRTFLTTAGSTIGPLISSGTIFGFYGASSYTGRLFGVTASSTGSQYLPGHGVFSATSAAPPNNVNFRDIRSYALNVIPYFNIIRSSNS